MDRVLVPSDQAAIVASIDPEAQGAATVTSDWVDASLFHQFMAILQTGVMAATSTVDLKVRQATDSSGTGVKDITGKSITQLTAAGTDRLDAIRDESRRLGLSLDCL